MIRTFIFLSLLPLLSFAHPHVFADVALKIELKNSQINTVQISWHYDEMTSQMLLMDYDKNRDGKFDKKESLFFKEQVFDTLKQYEYYTHIKIDGKKIPIDKLVKEFFLTFEKNKFIVNYIISLQETKQKSSIDIGFWDKEFYSSFDIDPAFVTFNKKLKFEIEEVEEDIYMGVVLKLKL